MIKFSICTPIFNRADYLSQMLDGIFRQTYKNYEIIIINDGGTDSTPMLIDYYSKKYPGKIKYIDRKINKGIAYTRNEANSHTTGDWVVVCDSDDIWLPNRLKLTIKYIERNPDIDFVYGGVYWTSSEGEAVREYWKPKVVTAELLREGKQTAIHGACAYKKWVAEKVPYRKEQKINDDFWFVVDCWNKGVRFGFIDRPLMGYRILNDGVSKLNYKKIQKEIKDKLRRTTICPIQPQI